ncbi:hypothetical protein [Methanonatronarchaeum sp. AMET-Sl]|uniref:hypothetical protein n=1 Tax=Methanonatronarchaeum sp. AMET-Sl TaxID=3037654 RepID=UPI00244DAAD5|nr:hypothetical protein [Methanonatronarchaeum sp. AMET-Sl]WGI17657.1 hypothetical protein QEN48_01215 [Methanonatronarchaeum sp. AMET-Sl]
MERKNIPTTPRHGKQRKHMTYIHGEDFKKAIETFKEYDVSGIEYMLNSLGYYV